MPITFSTSSFSFLKSSTTSQSNIEQNNTVDNVNKNNININDNLDFDNNFLNVAAPLERKVRSLDISNSIRNYRRNSNASSSNLKNGNRKWLKSVFVRFLSRWNGEDGDNDGCCDDDGNEEDYDKEKNDNDSDDKNSVKNNEIKDVNVDESVNDDGVIMMKPSKIRTCAVENQKNTFVHHGNTHDFYIVTNGTLLKSAQLPHPSSQRLSQEEGILKGHSPSSVFEKCAKTPRHYAKEPEVLGTVGRFTILREREDFDTTYFDTCHCQQKPCRFTMNGACGTHPTPSHDLIRSSSTSRQLTQQGAISISRTSYNTSRHSLPSLHKNNAKAAVSTSAGSSNCVLPQSASSPNLVHLNQRSKNENLWQNKNNTSRMNNNGRSIIIYKYPNPQVINSHGPCHSRSTTSLKARKPSLVNMKAAESGLNQELSISSTSTSSCSSPPSTPTNISKFFFHHHNEPHTTINSHSGRKFEVEWTCSPVTARSSTSSSTTSSSTFSSETSSSPPSSICSMASSPDQSTKSTTTTTLSRRCSTLSSKCGRKFEVTILSSTSSTSINALYTTSPHSTINSVISVAETTAANADPTKV